MTYWTHEESVAAQAAAQRRQQELADQLNARQHPEQRANLQEATRYSNTLNTPRIDGPAPTPSLTQQVASVRDVLEEALASANIIAGQLLGPQPGELAGLSGADSILSLVDQIDTLAHALRRQLASLQARL